MLKVVYQFKGSSLIHQHKISSEWADTLIKHYYFKFVMFYFQGTLLPPK